MFRDGGAVTALKNNHGTIDDVIDRYVNVISSTHTKGFSFELENNDLVIIAESEKPKYAKRKHLKQTIEFVNYSVGKNNYSSPHSVSLQHMNIIKFVQEMNNGYIGYVDDTKSTKTMIVSQKYFAKVKRKIKKQIRILEKRVNLGIAGRDDKTRLKKLSKQRGAKFTKQKTANVYDSLNGKPIYLCVSCIINPEGEDVDKETFYGRMNISFEPINNVRQIDTNSQTSAKYGYETGVRVNISYRGWHKKYGREAMDKAIRTLEDNYLGPLVDQFRNEKKEQIYFNKTTMIDKTRNFEVKSESFEGGNGIYIVSLPSQNIKFKGFRKRAKKKLTEKEKNNFSY